MRRIGSVFTFTFTITLSLVAGPLLTAQTADARGGGKVNLSVPADWPSTVPVPAGKISLIERDLTGNVTLHLTAPDIVQTTISGVDQAYTQAGFTLDPASTNPRYLTRIDYTVTVFFRAHDFRVGKTDLVITATAVPPPVTANGTGLVKPV
jgi:hypothetical protein